MATVPTAALEGFSVDVTDPEAIGLIETRGFIPLVVAVDAMSKSAHVSFLGVEKAGDGLITAVIGGDITSVTHAAEVGSAAAANVGEVVGVQIIGRVVGNLRDLLPIGNGHALLSSRASEPGLSRFRVAKPAAAVADAVVPQLLAGELSSSMTGPARRKQAPRRSKPASAHFDSERGNLEQ